MTYREAQPRGCDQKLAAGEARQAKRQRANGAQLPLSYVTSRQLVIVPLTLKPSTRLRRYAEGPDVS